MALSLSSDTPRVNPRLEQSPCGQNSPRKKHPENKKHQEQNLADDKTPVDEAPRGLNFMRKHPVG